MDTLKTMLMENNITFTDSTFNTEDGIGDQPFVSNIASVFVSLHVQSTLHSLVITHSIPTHIHPPPPHTHTHTHTHTLTQAFDSEARIFIIATYPEYARQLICKVLILLGLAQMNPIL